MEDPPEVSSFENFKARKASQGEEVSSAARRRRTESGGNKKVTPNQLYKGINHPALSGLKGRDFDCKILHAEKDGYSVWTLPDNLPGFLKTHIKFAPGDETRCTFVCVHRGRLLFSQIFPMKEGQPEGTTGEVIEWKGKNKKARDQSDSVDE